jgi:hypothetical protein
MFATLGRAVLVVVMVTATFRAAEAYTPSAEFLLRQLAEKRRDVGARDLSAQLLADVDGAEGPVEEYLYLKSPERLRLVAQRDEGSTIYVEREGQRAAGPENGLKRLSGSTDLTATLLVPAGKDVDDMATRMLAMLKAAGIDTSVVALGHQGDTVAYIIGARAFETEKPQVWLYKPGMQPLKTILIDKSKTTPSRIETRFIDFGSPVGGDYFPSVIEVYRDGKRVRRAELSSLSVNQSLPETLFDLPRTR